MSHETVISTSELEAESAELLPSRETMWCCKGGYPSHVTYNYTSQSYDGNGILNILNGSNFLNNVTVL